jgi:DNA-binding NarL/FixJ family response regulator
MSSVFPRSGCGSIATMRLLIVDDHEVVREGLRSVLATDETFDAIDEAPDGKAALASATRSPPDIALVDFKLPDMPGDELCAGLRAVNPAVHVVVVTTYLNEEIVRRCLAAGANAYITKDAGLGELRRVIAEFVTGASPATPQDWQILQRLNREVSDRSSDLRLTSRQVRVLELVAEGKTYKQVAQQLFLSQSTVRFHIQNLKSRLEVATVTELVAKAIRLSLIAPTTDAP